jgi:hypothetical protein
MAVQGDCVGGRGRVSGRASREAARSGSRPPRDTLITWHRIARVTAVRGDHAGAEAEFRDVLAAKSRALGHDHPDTLVLVTTSS